MKKTLLVFSCILASLMSFGYQNVNDTDSTITRSFSGFNTIYKARLDSIENKVPLLYNEQVHAAIENFTRRKVEMGKMRGLSVYYFPIFEKALAAFGVPDEIKYLPIVESSMDPFAVSKSGAIGLWQFMAGTAKGYRLTMNEFEDERRDPLKASYAAAAYLRDAYNEFGDWLLALAAYNCGSTVVSKAIAKVGSRNYWDIRELLPLQGQKYIPAFIAVMYTMNFADMHQIAVQNMSFNGETDTIIVDRRVSFAALAEAIGTDVGMLSYLNPTYKKQMINADALTIKKFVIPKIGGQYYLALFDLLTVPPDNRRPDTKIGRQTAGTDLNSKPISKT